MGRNLVVCCDGTGNFWRPAARGTNVVRLVEALPPPNDRQIFYYDPGVGTPDGYLVNGDSALSVRDLTARIAGLAWGDGVWTNVAEAYLFIVRHYRPGDRIFLLGFSRGAFTARAVGGLIHLCGLLRPQHDNMVASLLRVYRARAGRKRDGAGASLRTVFCQDVTEVHFTGVWDTVESVGMLRLLLGASITSNRAVKDSFRHVRHAVALDEQRSPYLPRLYDPPMTGLPAGHSFKQVYFCGAHSDVGGSYSHDGLSNAALHWMAREANAVGLDIDFNILDRHRVNVCDRLHDQVLRSPAWTILGVFRRDAAPAPVWVHESVLERRRLDPSYRPALPWAWQSEYTATHVIDASGDAVHRPVPEMAPPEAPSRQHWARWSVALLLLGLSSTAWILALWGAELWQLARMQSSGDLLVFLERLCGNDGRCPARLVGKDMLLLLSYSACLPAALLLVLRAGTPDGAVSQLQGRAARAGAVLPLADLFENWWTLSLWDAHRAPACSPLPCHWVESIYATLAFLASLLKLGALVVLAMLLVACLWRCLRRLTRRAGPQSTGGA